MKSALPCLVSSRALVVIALFRVEVYPFSPANETLGINLSRDWTNASLSYVSTSRPSNAMALNFQTLWWSPTRKVAFCYGGEISSNNSATRDEQLYRVPTESIWQFAPSGNGSGIWSEAVGPAAPVSYPPALLRPSLGASISDGQNGYYLGGYLSPFNTRAFSQLSWFTRRPIPGIQTLSFDSLELTNTSDGGYFANQYHLDNDSYTYRPGSMLHAPLFGTHGVLILLGGGGQGSSTLTSVGQTQFTSQGSFNNITIYDLHSKTWYSQNATGSIPDPRTDFCAVSATSSDNSTFDM